MPNLGKCIYFGYETYYTIFLYGNNEITVSLSWDIFYDEKKNRRFLRKFFSNGIYGTSTKISQITESEMGQFITARLKSTDGSSIYERVGRKFTEVM